jgi:HK97 family phage major capsid protein
MWVKLLKEWQKNQPGEVLEIPDQKAETLIELGHAEKTDQPKEVGQIAAELKAEIDTAISKQVSEGLKDVLKELQKPVDKSKRPRISVHDNVDDDPQAGFKSLHDFARSVRMACTGKGMDERLERIQKANGASEGINADGGFAVPVQYASNVYDDIMGQDSLFNRCFKVPMTSNSVKLPALNYTTQGSFGVTAYWTNEGGTITTSKPAYRQPQLTLNKLAALVPVTEELLEDGIAIEPIITKLAAEAITYQLNNAIIRGDGVGKPVGIIGHASTVAVAAESSGNGAGTLIAANVIKQRMRQINPSRAVWIANKDTEQQMLTMQDAAGRYLYFAPGSFAGKPDGRLLGMDVVPLINCSTVGTVGDIICADMQGYVIGYKTTGPQMAMSIHLYFNTDEVAYRWTFRVDGRPWRDATLAAAQGSTTYSQFVTVATRS